MVQSVERALSLLNRVASYKDGIGVRELAREAGLKAPTAHALLKTLLTMGYLDFNPVTRRYKVGLAVIPLANSVDRNSTITNLAKEMVTAFVSRFNETAMVGKLAGMQLAVIHSEFARRPLTAMHIERVIDTPHLLANGQAQLAFSTPEFQQTYVDRQDYSNHSTGMPKDKEELLTTLEEVRKRGFAETINLDDSGVGALGLPILDDNDICVMAVSCSAPLSRYTPALRDDMLRFLCKWAETIGYRVGRRVA